MAAADAATVAAAAAALVGQMAGTGLASNGSEARGATEGVPPVLPGADPKLPADDPEELFQEKPDEMERGFYDDLIAAKIPGSLVWYMSNENINSLEDLPNYCLTKESILETLIQACFPRETSGNTSFHSARCGTWRRRLPSWASSVVSRELPTPLWRFPCPRRTSINSIGSTGKPTVLRCPITG